MEIAMPALSGTVRAASRALSRAFPPPQLLTMPAAGIDISDASVKWLMLEQTARGFRVASWGEVPLPQGIVNNGIIKDGAALSGVLRDVKKHLGGVHFAHAALPEEAAYVFEMHIPDNTPHDEALKLIEFEFEGRVPISPEMAVFDFDTIQKHDGAEDEIGVAVFPRDLSESYAAAFAGAGIGLLSLEVEARSIARAVSDDDAVVLLVDFGRARTGFAVLKRGIPIFTSTVEVGGDAITHALAESLQLSPESAVLFRNEHGLVAEGADPKGLDAIIPVAAALSDEVARHYHYWDTRRNERGERMTPVSSVVIVGGSANLRGLSDYIAGRVQASALLGDIWKHVQDFEADIPPIDRRASLQYATAIGLALRSYLP